MNESDLIDHIYSTIADPTRWSEVIVRISDYLGALGGMVAISPQSAEYSLCTGDFRRSGRKSLNNTMSGIHGRFSCGMFQSTRW